MVHDTPFPISQPVSSRRLAVLLAVCLWRGICGAEPDTRPLVAVLDLPQDGFLAGTLLDVPPEANGSRATVLWQAPAFVGPFEFALNGIMGIRFPLPSESPQPTPAGLWRIELASGDQLVGDVESIDEEQIVVMVGAAASPTRISVRRDAVASIFRGDAGEAYAMPVGLAGWQQTPAGSWRDEAGRLKNAVPAATLVRNLEIGPRARYDLTLSWQDKPTLRLGIGDGPGEDGLHACRLELGPDGMVAVRDERGASGDAGRADLQPLGDLPDSSLKLTVFVDQQIGRLAVMLPGMREPVADLTIPPAAGRSAGGFSLAVVAGTASLDVFRVSPWRGGSLSLEDRRGSIRLRDGESLAAVVTTMQKNSGSLSTRPADGAAAAPGGQIPLESVGEILFPSAGKATDDAAGSVQVTDLCGSRLTGKLLRVERGVVWLSHPAVESPLPLPVSVLATLAGTERPESQPNLPGRRGRLACEQGSVWGCLVSGDVAAAGTGDDPGALAWQPAGSLNARPLAFAADGGQPQAVITYAEPPRPDAATIAAGAIGGIGGQIGEVNGRPAVVAVMAGSAAQRAGVMPGEMILAIAPRGDGRFADTAGLSLEDAQHLLRGRVGSRLQLRLQRVGQGKPRELAMVRQQIMQLGQNPQLMQQALLAHDRLAPPDMANGEPTGRNEFGALLILRTGETLPCLVEAIDEQGVHVRVPESEPVVVAADLVQAVELVPAAGKNMTAEKFRSLTMLPRSQRQQPPTHVLRSLQGDYLRGRLISMDAQTVRIAVEASPRDKPLAISRGDVARLIWLHPENLDTPWEPPRHHGGGGLLVESVARDDSRLRMTATGIKGNVLVGTSSVVGPCRIDLERIDRLLIGDATDGSPRKMPYSQWKLQLAPEPRNLPPAGRP